jgi:hypothetical protein
VPSESENARRLRELHDAYVWRVNAAVGEGREDLIWRLVDDYLDEAMQMMTDQYADACGRPDCTVCNRPPPERARPVSRRRWLRFFAGGPTG